MIQDAVQCFSLVDVKYYITKQSDCKHNRQIGNKIDGFGSFSTFHLPGFCCKIKLLEIVITDLYDSLNGFDLSDSYF